MIGISLFFLFIVQPKGATAFSLTCQNEMIRIKGHHRQAVLRYQMVRLDVEKRTTPVKANKKLATRTASQRNRQPGDNGSMVASTAATKAYQAHDRSKTQLAYSRNHPRLSEFQANGLFSASS
jgi:hypothetical protein